MTIEEIARGLTEALAEYDATMARCPANNLRFRSSDPCPRCKATATQSCGIGASAGYGLAMALRTHLQSRQP